MTRPVGSLAVAVVLAFSLFSALAGFAIENKHTEDFTTTEYKDTPNTTADWDTVAGALKLFPFAPTLLGAYDTPGYAQDVTVSGDYAFVADAAAGLLVVDISDPSNPTLAGSYNTPNSARDVAIAGDHAFVADFESGLQVLDISNPTSPTYVGSYDLPGPVWDVAVAGDHAYLANAGEGLRVIDISDPTNPTLAASYDTPGFTRAVTVDGNYAYMGDGASGLQIIDITDPTTPTLAGTYDTPGTAWKAVTSGDYVYVADGDFGLQVVDITDPTAPTFAGSYNTPGNARDVVVAGDHVYIADFASGVIMIDVSDPTNPTLENSYDTSGNARGVAVAGEHIFVGDGLSGLQVIDIADLVSPTLAGTYDTPYWAMDVTVSGDYAFVADGISGLQVIDILDPANPTLLGTYNTPDWANGVAVSGDYAFVADDDAGLQVIDISDPAIPALVGAYDTPSKAFDVAVSGDYAFVADYASGLQVIDISDPTSPALLGAYNTTGNAFDVTVSGNYAFVAGGFGGLQVIDISNPTNPTLVGTYVTPGFAFGVTVSGDYAFVADQHPGFQVIDISDPTNPALLGTYVTPGSCADVAVSGDYAFLADFAYGLQVIDISDPTSPALLGAFATPDSARGVTVAGDYAFVAIGGIAAAEDGLQVIRVFQREFNMDDNIGRSLMVDASNDTIFRARLTTTQTDSVAWELSADGGVSWQGILPGAGWTKTNVPGTDLLWRSTHAWAAPGGPTVTDLQIEWLVAAAAIEKIVDVPDDQGGWLSAHFTRSDRDFPDEVTLPISDYGIWRRVDNTALIAALNSVSSLPTEKSATGDTPGVSGIRFVTYQGKTYVESLPSLAASSFPPGTWEWVVTVPALQQDTYIAATPTAADSSALGTNHTVFVITAHTTTPSIWYVSEPDSGYSLDNIAPSVPTSFAVAYNTGGGNQLSWDPCPDADFQYFNVYRSSDPNFVPSPSELVHSLIGTNWADPEYDGWPVYYKVTALDFVGNESDPASAGTTTAVTEPTIPQTYALYPNVPNPFNPTTSIRYDVPAGGGAVTFRIYDVSGALVRTLLDGPQTAGQKTVTWNGRDDRGRSVASGVYFYRLQAPGYEKTLKMVLVQ